MSTPVVRARDMQAARCERCPPDIPCGDDVNLAARCHPGRGLRVSFNKRTSQLEIACRICKRPVANIAFDDGAGA